MKEVIKTEYVTVILPEQKAPLAIVSEEGLREWGRKVAFESNINTSYEIEFFDGKLWAIAIPNKLPYSMQIRQAKV